MQRVGPRMISSLPGEKTVACPQGERVDSAGGSWIRGQFFRGAGVGLHVEYTFCKIVAGRQRELGDAAYCSIAELQAAFDGLLSGCR